MPVLWLWTFLILQEISYSTSLFINERTNKLWEFKWPASEFVLEKELDSGLSFTAGETWNYHNIPCCVQRSAAHRRAARQLTGPIQNQEDYANVLPDGLASLVKCLLTRTWQSKQGALEETPTSERQWKKRSSLSSATVPLCETRNH